jgi:hypothetical protein
MSSGRRRRRRRSASIGALELQAQPDDACGGSDDDWVAVARGSPRSPETVQLNPCYAETPASRAAVAELKTVLSESVLAAYRDGPPAAEAALRDLAAVFVAPPAAAAAAPPPVEAGGYDFDDSESESESESDSDGGGGRWAPLRAPAPKRPSMGFSRAGPAVRRRVGALGDEQSDRVRDATEQRGRAEPTPGQGDASFRSILSEGAALAQQALARGDAALVEQELKDVQVELKAATTAKRKAMDALEQDVSSSRLYMFASIVAGATQMRESELVTDRASASLRGREARMDEKMLQRGKELAAEAVVDVAAYSAGLDRFAKFITDTGNLWLIDPMLEMRSATESGCAPASPGPSPAARAPLSPESSSSSTRGLPTPSNSDADFDAEEVEELDNLSAPWAAPRSPSTATRDGGATGRKSKPATTPKPFGQRQTEPQLPFPAYGIVPGSRMSNVHLIDRLGTAVMQIKPGMGSLSRVDQNKLVPIPERDLKSYWGKLQNWKLPETRTRFNMVPIGIVEAAMWALTIEIKNAATRAVCATMSESLVVMYRQYAAAAAASKVRLRDAEFSYDDSLTELQEGTRLLAVWGNDLATTLVIDLSSYSDLKAPVTVVFEMSDSDAAILTARHDSADQESQLKAISMFNEMAVVISKEDDSVRVTALPKEESGRAQEILSVNIARGGAPGKVALRVSGAYTLSATFSAQNAAGGSTKGMAKESSKVIRASVVSADGAGRSKMKVDFLCPASRASALALPAPGGADNVYQDTELFAYENAALNASLQTYVNAMRPEVARSVIYGNDRQTLGQNVCLILLKTALVRRTGLNVFSRGEPVVYELYRTESDDQAWEGWPTFESLEGYSGNRADYHFFKNAGGDAGGDAERALVAVSLDGAGKVFAGVGEYLVDFDGNVQSTAAPNTQHTSEVVEAVRIAKDGADWQLYPAAQVESTASYRSASVDGKATSAASLLFTQEARRQGAGDAMLRQLRAERVFTQVSEIVPWPVFPSEECNQAAEVQVGESPLSAIACTKNCLEGAVVERMQSGDSLMLSPTLRYARARFVPKVLDEEFRKHDGVAGKVRLFEALPAEGAFGDPENPPAGRARRRAPIPGGPVGPPGLGTGARVGAPSFRPYDRLAASNAAGGAAPATSVRRIDEFLCVMASMRRTYRAQTRLRLRLVKEQERVAYLNSLTADAKAARESVTDADERSFVGAAPLAAVVARGYGWIVQTYGAGGVVPKDAEKAWDTWVKNGTARQMSLFAEITASVQNETFLFAPRQYGYVNSNVYGVAGSVYWRRIEAANSLLDQVPEGLRSLRARVSAAGSRMY